MIRHCLGLPASFIWPWLIISKEFCCSRRGLSECFFIPHLHQLFVAFQICQAVVATFLPWHTSALNDFVIVPVPVSKFDIDVTICFFHLLFIHNVRLPMKLKKIDLIHGLGAKRDHDCWHTNKPLALTDRLESTKGCSVYLAQLKSND